MIARILIGLFVLAFGLAALHYVHFEDIEHHREWARANGMPEPAEWCSVLGALATALGGFVLGRVQRRKPPR
jgi:hypothetical protein